MVEPPPAGAPVVQAPVVEEPAPADDGPTSVRLPDFRDKDLADVKEALGVLGVTRIETVDATGDGRSQIVDSSWEVCTQDPRQGRDMKLSATITLGVVTQHERCP